MKPIKLFGTGVVGKSRAVTAERRLNCYYEIRIDGDKTNIAIYGTPGLTLFKAFGSFPIRGAWAVGNTAYIVQSGIFYSLSPGGAQTILGVLNTSVGAVSMIDNGYQILIVDGVAGYTYTFATTTFAKITSANFPNGATTCAFQDGFFLVENPAISGQFFKSALYDGTTWAALDYATMVSNPNPCIAVDSDHGYVILWGTLSIEFWQNTGATNFPFAPIRSMAQEYGLAAKFSRAKLNGAIFFLAQGQQGQVTIMKMTPGSLQRISSPDIDNIINNFSTVSDATGYGYMVDGHLMYEITFPSASRSFLYDDTTQMWSEVQTGVDLIGRHTTQYGFYWNGKTYCTDYQNGNLYLLDPNAYTDNGMTIKRLVQTRHQFNDLNEFSLDEIILEMETGIGLQTGQGQNPTMVMQVSKDKGRTFGLERPVSIGLIGQYELRGAHWSRMGSANDFVLRFYMTDPVKFAITDGYGMFSEGNQ